MFTVYVIRSAEGYIYTGYTDNVECRLKRHNPGESFWTKRGTDWRLIYTESHPCRSDALKREKWLKTGVGREFLRKSLRSAVSGS